MMQVNKKTEVVLKKRKQQQLDRAKEIRAKIKQKKLKLEKKNKLVFVRPEKFVKERRKRIKDMKRLKRSAKSLLRYMDGDEETDENEKLLFVIRLSANIPMSEVTKKALKALGITTKFSGAFVVANNETKRLLAIAEPFITWGTPNLRSIRELIFKRGLGRKNDGKAAPLMDNTIIEAALGYFGIICIEDLVHELSTVGPNFDHVMKFVGKFNLSQPLHLPPSKMTHVNIGGRYGDRGDGINELIQSMV